MRAPDTLRGQLLLRATVPMLVVIATSAAAAYGIAYRFASRAFDYSLLDTARTIATRVHAVPGQRPGISMSPGVREVLTYDPLDTVYYGVTSSRYGLLAGRGDLPTQADAPSDGLYYDGTVDGQPARFMVLPIGDGTTVVVGETLRKRQSLTRQIVFALVLTQAALVVVGGTLLWFGIARGMAPVRRIVDALAARGHHDLRPITAEPAAAELRSLVHSVNDLLARLDQSVAVQQRFVADAAHQLRTPIAGLLAQIDTALAGDVAGPARSSLEQLRISATRTARVVNQLLSLARAAPDQHTAMAFAPVDIAALVRKTCAELVPEALRCGLDLGYEGIEQAVHLNGYAPLLEDMVGNLIENAIRYGERGSTIDVRFAFEPNGLVLEVAGQGTPIPASERDRVFERFYRIPGTPGPGTGLGLAIVREVAHLHGAEAEVRVSGGGNRFRVVFADLAVKTADRGSRAGIPS